MNKRDATRLWNQLRDGFTHIEDVIRQIIEARAWEPLGYDSFVSAWNDRMAGIPLATDAARAAVVYAMFEVDGMDADEVRAQAVELPGIGSTRIQRIIEQHDIGVPVGAVSTVVRRHLRRKPAAAHVIHVVVTSEEYGRFKDVAGALDLDFTTEATEAVRRHFADLDALVEQSA